MSNSDIPLWIRRACDLWGRQKRRIWSGHDWHGNIDGYAQSLLGRLREEGEGAAYGKRQQHWPEVFIGEGLDVQRAVLQRKVSERSRIVLTFHYVWDPEWQATTDRKAQLIGIARSTYFKDLKVIQGKIHQFLESDAQSDDSTRQIIVGMITRELQKPRFPAIKRHTPSLCLEAMHRPVLSRSKD